jgi:hypothetical protein
MSCVPHGSTDVNLGELLEGVEPTRAEILGELRRWEWLMPHNLELTGPGSPDPGGVSGPGPHSHRTIPHHDPPFVGP